MPRTDFLFPSFTRGLVNGMANDTAPVEGLQTCNNVDFGIPPMGGITSRPPTVLRPDCNLANELTSPYKILNPRWLFRFRGYENDDWPYVLVGRQGAVLLNRALTETSAIINFDDNVYTDSRWAVFDENRVYFLGENNYPAVLEKDGGNLTIRPMGFRTTWNMSAAGSGGSVNAGMHYYQIVTVDKFGNHSSIYDPEDPYIAIETSASDKVTLSNISSGGSEDKKYIYRTIANPTVDHPTNPMIYYLVATIGDSVTSYDDTTADATIALNAILGDVDSFPPQDLAFAEVHNGTMWGFTKESSILRYTNQFGYEQWPVINAIPIGDPDYLTAIASVGDHLLLFKKNKLYAFWGSNVNNFDYREVSNIYGTSYIDTIKSIGNGRAIFLDTQRRVILYDNGNLTEISKSIKIPTPAWYCATLFRDYYMLWMYLPPLVDPEMRETTPVPIVATFPKYRWFREGEDPDGGGAPWPDPQNPPLYPGDNEPPPPWEFFDDVEYEWEHKYPGVEPGEPIKGPRHEVPPEGWYPPYTSGHVAALAYHIPSGSWSLWDKIQMIIPEKPDRSVDNFVFWNGVCVEVLGKSTTEDRCKYPDFTVRSIDSDCGAPMQEKSFKEIEVYLEYTSPRDFEGLVGQLEIFVDEGTSPVWQQAITFDTDNPVRRWRYRIKSGKNGKRVSVKFIGNQNMNRFALMGARLFWEPRGTPRRNA